MVQNAVLLMEEKKWNNNLFLMNNIEQNDAKYFLKSPIVLMDRDVTLFMMTKNQLKLWDRICIRKNWIEKILYWHLNNKKLLWRIDFRFLKHSQTLLKKLKLQTILLRKQIVLLKKTICLKAKKFGIAQLLMKKSNASEKFNL